MQIAPIRQTGTSTGSAREERARDRPISGGSTAFYENVVEVQKQNKIAHFELISQGKASSTVVTFLQGSPHVAGVQRR